MLLAMLYCGNAVADATSEMKPYNIGTPNMDFENGSLENWEQYIGGYYFDAEDNTYKYTEWEEVTGTDRISLITYPTIDPIISCSFDFTTSPSEKTTVRVGSRQSPESNNSQTTTHAAAERLVYRFKVTEDMGSLLYGYAPVLHLGNPNDGLSKSEHTDEQKPNITVSVSLYDTLTGVSTILPNSEFSAIKDELQYPDGETPCKTSAAGKNVTEYAFNRWTNNEIDLSAYIGQVLKIEVINHDCLRTDNKGVVSPGGHRSYGYFSAEILQPEPAYKYLAFTAEENGSEIWVESNNPNMPNIEFSYASCPWTPIKEIKDIMFGKGTKIYFRGNNPNGFSSEEGITSFKMKGTFSASGSVMSLIDGTGESTIIPNDYCFEELFKGCTSLIKAPELPATQLTYLCYGSMFMGCTNLEEAPQLPATTLGNSCYMSMFKKCTKLKKAPQLPAMILVDSCYNGMFSECTSLMSAPELFATELKWKCYAEMFEGCTALQQAPELPATELVYRCYNSMFKDCSELKYIKVGVLSLDNDADATKDWVNGVDSEGIFIFPCGSTYDKHGISEVPNNFKIWSSPIVVFQNPDGTELWSETIECGETPTYKGVTPTYGEGYIFTGWDKEFTELTESGTYYYTAIYDKGVDTGVETSASDNCTVWTEGLNIIVRGAQDNILIYNLNGQLIQSAEGDADKAVFFPMSAHGTYIVKAGKRSITVEL